MKVFYHSDLDGEASAAVAEISTWYDHPCFVPINYNISFPIDSIGESEKIFILDFSLQEPGMWDRLFEITKDVTWIDHHERAIVTNPNLSHLDGIRAFEIGGYPVAACELAWKFFQGDHRGARPIPLAISLIGDRDCWRFTHGDKTRNFVSGLLATKDTRPSSPPSPLWERFLFKNLDSETADLIEEICRIGEMIIEKSDISNAQDLESWGFEVKIEGLRGLCINRSHAGSDFFKSRADGYDVLVPIVFDGERWTVSLYAPPGGSDVDLSEIASRFGGSGHRGAAGFQCEDLPFVIGKRLIG